jgi:predicted branched-subunit amino acid permease
MGYRCHAGPGTVRRFYPQLRFLRSRTRPGRLDGDSRRGSCGVDVRAQSTWCAASITGVLICLSLAVMHLGSVVSLQYTFRVLTGHEEQPQLTIVVSTLVIAALFSPLRRRI